MNRNQIRQFASDPAEFRASIVVPTTSGTQRFGDIATDFQTADFKALDPPFIAARDGKRSEPSRFWFERVKGASKTSDMGLMLLWLLAFGRAGLLSQAAAKDSDQADEIRKAMRDILRCNRWLQQRIEVQRGRVRNTATDSTLDILTVDEHGAHGARPDVLFVDEIVHIENRDFVETLLDNAAKTSALIIIATNAGFVPSWQYDLREMARQSERWYFSEVTSPAPWISEANIEERRLATPPNRFNRLWRGQWVADHGDALHPSDIDSAVTLSGPVTGSEPDLAHFTFAAGLDIGIRKDSTALVIVGRHVGGSEQVESKEKVFDGWDWQPKPEFERIEATYRYRLAGVEVWRPSPGNRVSLEAVRLAIVQAHKLFGLSAVCIDPHQAEHLAELLQFDGVPVQLVPQTGPTLNMQATVLVEVFQQHVIDLYSHDDLLADIRALQIQEKSYGVRLLSPHSNNNEVGTAHGDTATALSIALRAVSDAAPRKRGQLMDWLASDVLF